MLKIIIPFQDEIPSEVTKLATELNNQRTNNLNIEIPLNIALQRTQIDGLFTVNSNEHVGCAEQSEAHRSRLMRLLSSAASYNIF